MNLVEISTVPFQVIFGIRLYLSTQGTDEGKKSLRSQVTGKIVQQMESWKIKTKQGAGVDLPSRERWQTKDPALPEVYTHANKTLNQAFMYLVNGKHISSTHFFNDISSFQGHEWVRI